MEVVQFEALKDSFATYLDYTNARLCSATPETKKTKDQNGMEIVYYQIPFMYNYGSHEKRVLNEFLIEGCEMYSKDGIITKPNARGGNDYSILVKFDNANDDHCKFVEAMKAIHFGTAHILNACKGQVKLYNFTPNMAEATGLKSPIYIARDEMTGEIIQGKAASMFLKLFSRGKPPMVEQTLFTDPSEEKIPWHLLNTVEMKFIPLIHVKRIYIGGGKASIQMEIISAIVTNITPKNTTTKQLSTINKLNASNPNIKDIVGGQIAKLKLERQDQLVSTNPAPVTTNAPESTFIGIQKPTMSDFTANPTPRETIMMPNIQLS